MYSDLVLPENSRAETLYAGRCGITAQETGSEEEGIWRTRTLLLDAAAIELQYMFTKINLIWT